MRQEGKVALYRRYIEFVHKFHRWLYKGGANQAEVEATTYELYEFVRPSFTREVIRADQMAAFPQGNEYLRELWQSIAAHGLRFDSTRKRKLCGTKW